MGYFPWYGTFNYLNERLPEYRDNQIKMLSRNAGIGFSASLVSDTVSNSIRVIKTTKQSYHVPISYFDITKKIIREDGMTSLFGRGLKN